MKARAVGVTLGVLISAAFWFGGFLIAYGFSL